MNKVAIVVLGYRMAAMTDALVARIREVVKYPHDLFVIDNGSPDGEIAKSTTHHCEPNRRLTGGFNYGIEKAREREQSCFVGSEEREIVRFPVTADGYMEGYPYDAVWLVCNDIQIRRNIDPLFACMAWVRRQRVLGEPLGVIHPALSEGPGVWNWPHMYANPATSGIHDAWFTDIVCPVYTREAMEVLGWQFDPALVHGWGVDLYSCFECWQHDLRVVVCDDVEVWHKMGTTYDAGKDPEFASFDAYKAAAGGSQLAVLEPKYGAGYDKRFAAAPAEYWKRRRERAAR